MKPFSFLPHPAPHPKQPPAFPQSGRKGGRFPSRFGPFRPPLGNLPAQACLTGLPDLPKPEKPSRSPATGERLRETSTSIYCSPGQRNPINRKGFEDCVSFSAKNLPGFISVPTSVAAHLPRPAIPLIPAGGFGPTAVNLGSSNLAVAKPCFSAGSQRPGSVLLQLHATVSASSPFDRRNCLGQPH